MIRTIDIKNKEEIEKIKNRKEANLDLALLRVKPVIESVKKFGDKSLIEYTKKYDCFDVTKNTIEIKSNEIKEAYKKVDKGLVKAIKEAAEIIKKFSKEQLPKEWNKEIRKKNKRVNLKEILTFVTIIKPSKGFKN